MLVKHIAAAVLELLKDLKGKEAELISSSGISGGCINDAAHIVTTVGEYFVKWNNADKYPGMFEAEAKGLRMLAETHTVKVPKVVGQGQAAGDDFLVLEYIEPGSRGNDFWNSFGTGMAKLHKHTSGQFGLDHDNYIGSLVQQNKQHDNWVDFFTEERLQPQLELALKSKRAGKELETAMQRLYPRLNDVFPTEPPSLLHGDLWSGNYLTAAGGNAVIIDPAVCYGHRYMDLGMSKLFGGFSQEFYHFYNQHYPLEDNWQQGIDVANLYPLLVHVNLFGGGYLGSVMRILAGFS